MHTYKIKIKKVSGTLNESVLPSRNLVIKSKSRKTNNRLFAEASSYYKKKYGLVIESADVKDVVKFGDFEVEKDKWINDQYDEKFRFHDYYDVMEEILRSAQGKKAKYVASDNENTGVHDEFEENVNTTITFGSKEAEEILDNLTNKRATVRAKITSDNVLEIYITTQYYGDWVEYRQSWDVSL